MTEINKEQRGFSVELVSKKHLARLSADGSVLVEGTLGELQHASFVEPEILEVKGTCGVVRLNLRFNEIKNPIGKIGGEKP